MQAYLGDAALKRKLVAEIKKHEQADQIVKGTYGQIYQNGAPKWKGCAIGCALHSLNVLTGQAEARTDQHQRLEDELGIPVELAYHIDTLFESLPDAQSQTWPRRVAQAITPGADLSGVMPALLQWMILDPEKGWIAFTENEVERASFRKFAGLVAQDWRGDTVSPAQWDEMDQELARAWAGARAWAWAGARAWAWAWAWAGAGARARAWARAWAGARAWAWAWAGAGARAYVALSQQTLKLLKEAK